MPIYAIPVINGKVVPASVDFVADEHKAKIVTYVPDDESVEFLDNIKKRINHSLSVQFGNSKESHTLFNDCRVRIVKVDSIMEDLTAIELLVTNTDVKLDDKEYIRTI